MWKLPFVAVVLWPCLASSAGAYEYSLQFTPNYGARGLTVAGYAFVGDSVFGNCSYYTVTGGGSGRGGGYHSHTTYYNQTCGWDLFGNLLTVTQGAPTPPAPLSVTGGLTIYARDAAGDTTGVDTGRGFVNTLSAQYAWLTPATTLFLPNRKPAKIVLQVRNVGDLPLVVSGIDPTARLGRASVSSTTCNPAPVAAGGSCRIVVLYNALSIPKGDDPYTAYDTLTVGLVANSGQAPDFSEPIAVPIPPN